MDNVSLINSLPMCLDKNKETNSLRYKYGTHVILQTPLAGKGKDDDSRFLQKP